MKKFFNARRTKNNDILFFSGNIISINNIMLVLSVIMLLLCFCSFIRLDLRILLEENYTNYSELRRIPYFSPINLVFNENVIYYMLGDGGIENIPTLNGVSSLLQSYAFLLVVPVLIIIIYFVNRKLVKSTNKSYKILMLQYSLILLGGSINYMLLRFLAEIIKLDKIIPSLGDTNGAFKVTFAYSLYGIFNIILIILALYGILYTGTKEIDEELISTNVFSKEAMKKTSEFAKDLGQNLGQNMEVVSSVATKVANDVKEAASSKLNNIKEIVEESKAENILGNDILKEDAKEPLDREVEKAGEESQKEDSGEEK